MSRRTSYAEGSLSPRPFLELPTLLTMTSEGAVDDQAFSELFNFPVEQDVHFADNLFRSVNFPSSGLEVLDQQMPGPIDENVSPTVSMQDVLLNSEPASTAFTNLTTPGSENWDSPFAHSTDTSPIFAVDSNLPADANNWGSLFEGDNFNDMPVVSSIEKPVPDVHVAPHMSRNTSSPGQSSNRSSNQGPHSYTSGVNSRRRDKPLPAITIDDPTDVVKVKRARNTMAARKSREKRVQRNDQLEAQVAELETQVDYWKRIATDLGHQE